MNEEKNSENGYRSILKGTSIFGGVQIFQILINLIRGKFVAMFLGPAGMGAASLFNSSSGTLIQLSSLGLNLAFVKEIAANKDDAGRLATIRHIASLLIRFTALLGALACSRSPPEPSLFRYGRLYMAVPAPVCRCLSDSGGKRKDGDAAGAPQGQTPFDDIFGRRCDRTRGRSAAILAFRN